MLPSRLVGRAADLTLLSSLMTDSDIRLLTLTDRGSTGKTRLVPAAVAAAARRFRDGAREVCGPTKTASVKTR